MRSDGDEEGFAYQIETPRLYLRPRLATDEAALAVLAANPAIAPNICTTVPADAGERLTIVARADGAIVGAAVHGVTGLGSGVEIGLWIGEFGWFRGYGTEAAHALIDRAFADGTAGIVWCSNRVTNTRARRVIEKCGFQFRGGGMVRIEGYGAFPIERFALDRRNWASLKAWGASGNPSRDRAEADREPRESAA